MLLDAPTFEVRLTPEAALSIVQKEIARRGWKKYEIQEVRLSYVPYWVFSFDVSAEGAAPTGRAGVNAATGDLDEFVPAILDKPLKKTKTIQSGEVEPTNISKAEINAVAAAKMASAVGLKKENITISAAVKYYVPFYSIWAIVPSDGDVYRINVDGLLGAPFGVDALPAKVKDWSESTAETLEKMKTPKGWVDLAGSAAAGGGVKGIPQPVMWGALLLIVIVLSLFVFKGSNVSGDCRLSDSILAGREYWLFGQQYVRPKLGVGGTLYVTGTCTFTNNDKEAKVACVKATVVKSGKDTAFTNSTCIVNIGPGETREKDFKLTWTERLSQSTNYAIKFERVV